jgi:methenyltetrahydromethanopterin cyclohydrolase
LAVFRESRLESTMQAKDWRLNERARGIVEQVLSATDDLRIRVQDVPGGGRVVDCGVQVEGGLEAGLALARICTAGLADVSLAAGELGGIGWPHLHVATDHPVEACLFSQYAGWQIAVEKFFAMGSGPMRAAAGREELFERAACAVGVLEGRKLAPAEVFAFLQERTEVPADQTTLLVAPTASQAGNVQVAARVVETALHKLYELAFDLTRLRSAAGAVPLPPVACDDLTGIGRTNDAILYGGRVTLWVRGDDESIAAIGPRVPSVSSPSYGRPFLEIFEAAGRDFYKIDPQLFSPAEVVFQNLDTGHVQRFGAVDVGVLRNSFGM